MIYGYARVSTSEQETNMQIDALTRAGAITIYAEKASSIGHRPQLDELLARIKPGDQLMVWKIDRLARSLTDLLHIIARLQKIGCSFRSLTEPIDTSNALGEFLLQILGAVAQLERCMIRERVLAGQVAAISRGGKHGRPSVLDDDQEQQVLQLYLVEKVNKTQIAKKLGVGRWVVDRVICQALHLNQRRYGPKRPVLGPLLERAGRGEVK